MIRDFVKLAPPNMQIPILSGHKTKMCYSLDNQKYFLLGDRQLSGQGEDQAKTKDRYFRERYFRESQRQIFQRVRGTQKQMFQRATGTQNQAEWLQRVTETDISESHRDSKQICQRVTGTQNQAEWLITAKNSFSSTDWLLFASTESNIRSSSWSVSLKLNSLHAFCSCTLLISPWL